MLLRLETIPEKKLIGKRLSMTLARDKTGELWRSFMPRRREIQNNLTTELISMQVYNPAFTFNSFNADTPFEKWATVEVTDFKAVPAEMETYTLPGGLYAVFLHKGAASTGAKTFEYIFKTWLPEYGYVVDNRPHFELLGEKYKNEDPNSEEEIWIPIKRKNKL